MMMCVLLCYPVSFHMSQLLLTGRPISSCNSSRLARDALVLGRSAASEIPLQLPVSTTLLKQSLNQVFHNNPQQLNLHAWCLGVDSSKNKVLWKWQRELLPLKGHQ